MFLKAVKESDHPDIWLCDGIRNGTAFLFCVKLFVKRRMEKGKKQYKRTKLLFGILSIVLITVVLAATIGDALANKRETSGGVGVLVAGILGLTVHSGLFGEFVFGF